MFVVDLLRDSTDEDHVDSEWFWVSYIYILLQLGSHSDDLVCCDSCCRFIGRLY